MVVSSEYPENVLITRLLTMYLPLPFDYASFNHVFTFIKWYIGSV